MNGDSVLAQAASLPKFTTDPVQRLRHTLAAFENSHAGDRIITATHGMPSATGHEWTGLTWGDLRALLEHVEQADDPSAPAAALQCEANHQHTPHSGPIDQWVVFTSSRTPGKVLSRTPVCRSHADYEVAWPAATGMIARAHLEPITPEDES